MSDRHSPNLPDNAKLTGVLKLDAEKYRGYVDELDVTEEQKLEFLQTLWWIMSAFVDLGFRVDSVQTLLPLFEEASSVDESDAVKQTNQHLDSSKNEVDHD